MMKSAREWKTVARAHDVHCACCGRDLAKGTRYLVLTLTAPWEWRGVQATIRVKACEECCELPTEAGMVR